MKFEEKYKSEEVSFRNAFNSIRDKKIALYGIGRLSASLLPQISDYNIIGFLDKDPNNIGKDFLGKPIISVKYAEQNADLVIINTSATYWESIYRRIENIQIPVYFLNGKLACNKIKENDHINNKYWDSSYTDLLGKIEQYDIISFDVFDTILTRKVYLPQDVWNLIDIVIHERIPHININYPLVRRNAISRLDNSEYTLEELYAMIKKISGLNSQIIKRISDIELEIENQVIILRDDMANLFNETVKMGKRVYLITDMYLPKKFLFDMLINRGILIEEEQILLSNVLRKSKLSGKLWEYYKGRIVKESSALHIGDNIISDIKMSEKYGISTYYIMSGREMLKNSSMYELETKVCGLYDSLITGIIVSSLFNNPFKLNLDKGDVFFRNFKEIGYAIFGPIVVTYLLWIIKEAKENQISKILFFARDGYFLYKNYKYLSKILKNTVIPDSDYLAISRRLALIASINDRNDLEEAKRQPYRGTFSEYMYNRFGVETDNRTEEENHREIVLPGDIKKINIWIDFYIKEIKQNISREQSNYYKYLMSKQISDKCAVVDLWYYGTNQYYLERILGIKMNGYYMAANLSKDNIYNETCKLIPCFQKPEDLLAEECALYNKCLLIESFFTAPYGMILSIDENGKYICDKPMGNQIHFQERMLINNGIQQFINDFISIYENFSVEISSYFIDSLFRSWTDNNCIWDKNIKNIFYWDNGIMQKGESTIFE